MIGRPGAELAKLLAALQFFLRLPMPAFLTAKADHESGLDEAAHLFPIVGLVVALAPVAVLAAAAALLPPMLAAGLAVLAGIWATGALHEDGLADCADGLGGSADRERALEIMRDSAVGTFGMVALTGSIGLRWAALAVIAQQSAWLAAAALFAAHAVSRGGITTALTFSSYARRQGTGSLVAAGIDKGQWSVAIAISALLAALFCGWAGLAAAIAALIAAALFLLYFEARIGGYTGDCLGAMQQIGEATCLILLAAILV